MKKLFPIVLIITIVSLALTSCDALFGEEIGRLPINKVSTEQDFEIKEITLDLKKDEKVAIWSEIDIEYDKEPVLEFRFRVVKDEQIIDEFSTYPLKSNVTVGSSKTTINNKTKWKFSGKNDEITPPEDGKYIFYSMLVADSIQNLKVNKAEIVFKK